MRLHVAACRLSAWRLFLAAAGPLLAQAAGTLTFQHYTPLCVGTEGTCGWAAGGSMTIAARLMVQYINSGNFLRKGMTLKLDVIDDQCSGMQGLQNSMDTILLEKNKWPFGVVGCGCSGCTKQAAPMMRVAYMPLISHSATSPVFSNRATYPDFFRIFPPDGPQVKMWFEIFKSLGWKTYAMILDIEFGESFAGFVIEMRKLFNMTDVLEGSPVQLMKAKTPAVAKGVIDAIIPTRTRAVMFVGYQTYLAQLACQISVAGIRGMYMGYLGWYSAGWWQAAVADLKLPCTVAEMDFITDYWISVNPPPWGDPASKLACAPTVTTKKFAEDYEAERVKLGEEVRAEASAAGDAVCMMALLFNEMIDSGYSLAGLNNMNESTFKAWSAKAQKINFIGSSGGVSFPSDPTVTGGGDRKGPFLMYQKVNNKIETIGMVVDGPTGIKITYDAGKSLKFSEGYTAASPPPNFYVKCPYRTYYNFSDTKCYSCPSDKVFVDSAGSCLCKPGLYAVNGTCKPCNPGTFSEQPGTVTCSNCAIGKFSPGGKDECGFCPRGRYAATVAKAECTECPDGFATENIASINKSACVCPEKFYLPLDGTKCESCKIGMKCAIGSSVANYKYSGQKDPPPFPMLMPRHWSSPAKPLSVFVCESENKCPGGPPGTCGPKLTSAVCAHCEEGWMWDGTQCYECTSVEASKFLFPVMPLLLFPIVILGMYKFFGDTIEKWGSWQNGCAAVGFVTLTHYQMINILKTVKIDFPKMISGSFEIWEFSNDFMSLFKPQCTGYADFSSKMLFQTLGPALMGVLTLVVFGVCFGLSKINPVLLLNKDRLFNAFGSLIFTFFGAIAAMSLQLFKCTENPNDELTLAQDLSVICYSSDDWKSMLVVGIIAVIVYIIGCGSMFVYIVSVAAVRFKDKAFQMRWKFLFIKYRPDVAWWCLIFLLKNFLFNFGFVISAAPVAQFIWMLSVQLWYVLLIIAAMPYRHRIVNMMELVVGLSIVYAVLVLVSLAYEQNQGTDKDTLSLAIAITSFAPALIALFSAGRLAFVGINKKMNPSSVSSRWLAEIDDIINGLSAITELSPEDQGRLLCELTEWDRHYLFEVRRFTEMELFAKRAGGGATRVSSRVVVDAPKSPRAIKTKEISVEGSKQEENGNSGVVSELQNEISTLRSALNSAEARAGDPSADFMVPAEPMLPATWREQEALVGTTPARLVSRSPRLVSGGNPSTPRMSPGVGLPLTPRSAVNTPRAGQTPRGPGNQTPRGNAGPKR